MTERPVVIPLPQANPRIDPRTFGDRLRRRREQRQLSLQDIANSTKIGIHQLRALERGDLHLLPAGLYLRAKVRQYAEAVGLDVDETLRELAALSAVVDIDLERLAEAGSDPADEGSSSFATALWTGVAGAVLMSLLIVALVTGSGQQVPEPVAEASSTPVTSQAIPPAREDIELPSDSVVIRTGGVDDSDATEGELRITSEPAGAQVTVNGIGWGITPLTIRYIPLGEKVIRASKPGYVSAQRGIELAPDRRVRSVHLRLSPDNR